MRGVVPKSGGGNTRKKQVLIQREFRGSHEVKLLSLLEKEGGGGGGWMARSVVRNEFSDIENQVIWGEKIKPKWAKSLES